VSFKDYKISPLPLSTSHLSSVERGSIMKAQQLSLLDFQETYPAGYRPFRPNNNGYHSSRRCYRGGCTRLARPLPMQCFLGIRQPDLKPGTRGPRLYQHCKVFAPAAPRREDSCLRSISRLCLTTRTCVVGSRYATPTTTLIGRRPILGAGASISMHPAVEIYRVLYPVSRVFPT